MGKNRKKDVEVPTADLLPFSARVCVYVLAFLIHSISFFFYFCLGIIPLYPIKNMTEVLQVYNPPLTSFICFVIAFLHLLGIFQAVCKCCKFYCTNRKNSNVSNFAKSAKTEDSSLYNIFPVVGDLFGSSGKYGKYGKYYEYRLIFREIIEVPSASYQAYLLSHKTTKPAIMLSFSFLIAMNCFTLVITLSSRNIFIRRFGTLLCDTIYDFMFSAVFSILLLMSQAMDLYVDEDTSVTTDKVWLTGSILIGRQVFITSLGDLLTKTFPSLMSYLSVQGLINYISVAGLRKINAAKSPSYQSSLIAIHQKSKNKCLFLLSIVWGIILLCSAASASFNRLQCPKSCLLRVTPWFSEECKCVVEKINCKKLNITSKQLMQRLNDSTSTDSLFILEITQCRIPNGPSVKVLNKFNSLYGLYIYFTDISSWDNYGHNLPQNLNVLEIIGSRLNVIPSFLITELPDSMRYLYFTKSLLSHIPNEVRFHWQHLYSIGFSSSKFSEVPVVLLHLKASTIYLTNNQIASFNITPSSYLTFLDLSFNQLSSVPDDLLHKLPRLRNLHLTGNSISRFPFTLKNFSVVSLNNNPICSRSINRNSFPYSSKEVEIHAVCGKDACGSHCTTRSIGNSICNPECNTKECKFDGGDCEDYLHPLWP